MRSPSPNASTLLCIALSACTSGTTPGKDEVVVDDLPPTGSDDNALRNLSVGSWLPSGSTGCVADSGRQEFSGLLITGYETQGLNDGTNVSASPGPGASNVYTRRTDGACPGTTTGRSRNGGSGSIAWTANGGDTDFSTCYRDTPTTACSSSEVADPTACSGNYEVLIDPKPGAVATCTEFNPVQIVLNNQNGSGERRSTSESDQSSGAGRFMLVPLIAGDNDGDGLFHASYKAMQQSGSGVITNNSWITSVTVVDDNGASLRLIKPDQLFSSSTTDGLVNESTVSIGVSGTQQFSSGTISGNAPFTVSEVADGDLWGMEVDLTWTTGSGATTVSRPLGWQFRLSDIGCSSWPQKLTMRYASGPNRVYFELYGDPTFAIVEPLQTTSSGDAFTVNIGHLYLEATITAHSANSATVRIDELTWDGTNICSAGTYTLAPE